MITETITTTACVALEHTMAGCDGFEDTAYALHELVREAQREHPGAPRQLALAIEGHRLADGRFDADASEIQREFLDRHLVPYLSQARLPLRTLTNSLQDDDPPAVLVLDDAEHAEWGDR
jgi:hypothetical protein